MAQQSKKKSPPAAAGESRLPGESLARWASYASIALGVLLVFHGGQQMFSDAPPPVPYTVCVVLIGLAEALLPFLVLRGSRPAWSFLVSLNGTMAVVTLFGGPRIRDTFDVPFAVALIPCVVFGVVTTLAAMASDDF